MATDERRVRSIADAFEAAAEANHYMVTVSKEMTLEEVEAAEQLLIERQNKLETEGDAWNRLERALDLVEQRIEEITRAK